MYHLNFKLIDRAKQGQSFRSSVRHFVRVFDRHFNWGQTPRTIDDFRGFFAWLSLDPRPKKCVYIYWFSNFFYKNDSRTVSFGVRIFTKPVLLNRKSNRQVNIILRVDNFIFCEIFHSGLILVSNRNLKMATNLKYVKRLPGFV